ncbi:transformation/transcription domain-associated protein-like protein isoform X2 [Tanacetum coccineum]
MAFKETHDEIWLEYTVNCFLQGIKFGIPNSRSHLACVLYLISFDTPNEPVGRAFDKFLDQIPHWVWLSWIPQLLLSQRSEAPHCKLVLLKVATVYPQLRTYLLERRDVANKSELGRMAMAQQRMQQNMAGEVDGNARQDGGSSASDNQLHPGTQSTGPVGSHDGGSSQGQELERPTFAEGNVLGGNENHSSMSDDGQNSMRHNYAMGLVASAASAFDAAKDIIKALRSKHTNLASELEFSHRDRFKTFPNLSKRSFWVFADAVNKHVEFVKEYKQDFEHHLDPESTATFPTTLYDLTETLKHWKTFFRAM